MWGGMDAASRCTYARSGATCSGRDLRDARWICSSSAPGTRPLPRNSHAQSVSSNDLVVEQMDAAVGGEQVELVRQTRRQRRRTRRVPEVAGRARARRDSEPA